MHVGLGSERGRYGWRQAGRSLITLNSCLVLPKGDSALQSTGRLGETTGPKSMTVAERLPWTHPSPAVSPLAGAPGMPLTSFLPSPLSFPGERKRAAGLSSAVHAVGPRLGSAALPVCACCLPAPTDLLFVQLGEKCHHRPRGPLLFLGHVSAWSRLAVVHSGIFPRITHTPCQFPRHIYTRK